MILFLLLPRCFGGLMDRGRPAGRLPVPGAKSQFAWVAAIYLVAAMIIAAGTTHLRHIILATAPIGGGLEFGYQTIGPVLGGADDFVPARRLLLVLAAVVTFRPKPRGGPRPKRVPALRYLLQRDSGMNNFLEQLRSLVDAVQYRLGRDSEIDPRFLEEVLAPRVEDLLQQAFEKIDHLHAFGGERSNQVIHYTRATTVEALLEGTAAGLDPSLRLYDSASFNDPDEGEFFVRNLSLPRQHQWILQSNTSHAYVVSFIIPDASFKLSDDLMFWRTYGREGEGCSLVLSVPPSRLRKILYGRQHVQAVRGVLVPFLDVLNPLVNGHASSSRNLRRTALGTAVWRVLAKKLSQKADELMGRGIRHGLG